MYRLPQSGILVKQLLEQHLNYKGYIQIILTFGYWKHDWRTIYFTLFEEKNGVEYVGKEHAKHLVATLNEHYIISQYWEGGRYLGVTLDWD